MVDETKQATLPGLPDEAKEFFDSRGEKDSTLKDDKPEVKTEEKKVETKEAKPDKVELVDENEAEIELDDHGKPKNPGKWIRHGAFHQERERRKAAEAKLVEATTGQARLDERLKLLSEAVSPKQEAPAGPPNPEEDIFGAVKFMGETLQTIQKRMDESKTQNERERAQNDLTNAYKSDAMRFAQANPDFVDAYSHLMQGRRAELQAFGYTDDASIMKQIAAEESLLVENAVKLKKSPAEMVYELAKTRGYAKKPVVNGNGAVPSADAKKLETETKIDAIAKAQSASKSLSGTGGGTADSLTELKNLSDNEFNALYQSIKHDPAKLRQFFGQ